MTRIGKLVALGFVAFPLFLTACGTSAGPSLEGNLIVYSDERIYEFSQNPSEGTVDIAQISDSASRPILSRDKHFLIFAETRNETRRTVLLDLRNGNEKVLHPLEDAIPCSLSPDGRYFSYITNKFTYDPSETERKLYIHDVSSDSATFVVQAPYAAYSIGGVPSDHPEYVFGELSCGNWIGSDRLLFQRTASMPEHIFTDQYQVMPDTTTLAIVEEETIALQNVEQVIEIKQISEDSTYFLVSCKSASWCLSESFDDLKEVNNLARREIPNGFSVSYGFVSSRELYYIDSEYWRLHFVDLATLEDKKGVTLPSSSYWTFNGVWIGDPNNHVGAVIDHPNVCKSSEECIAQVLIVRLDGRKSRTILGNVPYNIGPSQAEIIGWLPP